MSDPVIKLLSQESNVHHSTDTLLEAHAKGKLIFGVSGAFGKKFQLFAFDSVKELTEFNHNKSFNHPSYWYFLALDPKDYENAMDVSYHYEHSIELDEKLRLENGLERLESSILQETANPESVTAAQNKTPIEDLNLSVRTYNCLKRTGYNYAEEVILLTEHELLHIRNFGRKCYTELRDTLIARGFIDGASEGFVPIVKPQTSNQITVDDEEEENMSALNKAIQAVIETTGSPDAEC